MKNCEVITNSIVLIDNNTIIVNQFKTQPIKITPIFKKYLTNNVILV